MKIYDSKSETQNMLSSELVKIREEIAACSSEKDVLKARRTEMCIINQNEIARYEMLKFRIKELQDRESEIQKEISG